MFRSRQRAFLGMLPLCCTLSTSSISYFCATINIYCYLYIFKCTKMIKSRLWGLDVIGGIKWHIWSLVVVLLWSLCLQSDIYKTVCPASVCVSICPIVHLVVVTVFLDHSKCFLSVWIVNIWFYWIALSSTTNRWLFYYWIVFKECVITLW